MNRLKDTINKSLNEYKEMDQNLGNINFDDSLLKELDEYSSIYIPEIQSKNNIDLGGENASSSKAESEQFFDNNTPSDGGTKKRKRPIKEIDDKRGLSREKKTNKNQAARKALSKKDQDDKEAVQKDFLEGIYSFVKYFENVWKTSQNAKELLTQGRNDNYINFAWNTFNECYKSTFHSWLVSFDAFTDLFYIQADKIVGKTIIAICVSEQTFNARTEMNLCAVRRLLFDKNILLLTVPFENILYDYFLNKIVIPYMYYANAQRGSSVCVYVVDENAYKPDLINFQTIETEALYEKIKKLYCAE